MKLMMVDKKRIMIFSSPRTGSSILGQHIEKRFQIPYFHEPDWGYNNSDGINVRYWAGTKNKERVEQFTRHVMNTDDSFVGKIHIYRFRNNKFYHPYLINYLMNSDEVFRIRIMRDDIVAQLKSLYIAHERKRMYHFTAGMVKEFQPDYIKIRPVTISRYCRALNIVNNMLRNADINFDLDLTYETLPVIDNVRYVKVPRPLNDKDIEAAVIEELRKYENR